MSAHSASDLNSEAHFEVGARAVFFAMRQRANTTGQMPNTPSTPTEAMPASPAHAEGSDPVTPVMSEGRSISVEELFASSMCTEGPSSTRASRASSVSHGEPSPSRMSAASVGDASDQLLYFYPNAVHFTDAMHEAHRRLNDMSRGAPMPEPPPAPVDHPRAAPYNVLYVPQGTHGNAGHNGSSNPYNRFPFVTAHDLIRLNTAVYASDIWGFEEIVDPVYLHHETIQASVIQSYMSIGLIIVRSSITLLVHLPVLDDLPKLVDRFYPSESSDVKRSTIYLDEDPHIVKLLMLIAYNVWDLGNIILARYFTADLIAAMHLAQKWGCNAGICRKLGFFLAKNRDQLTTYMEGVDYTMETVQEQENTLSEIQELYFLYRRLAPRLKPFPDWWFGAWAIDATADAFLKDRIDIHEVHAGAHLKKQFRDVILEAQQYEISDGIAI
ncbi:hypothetical protein F4804DRAFT_351111 [Jackrogersella minutella]|nr:hypothetical protein F4804DRAFT_351111 [Jackrogersella minutella]